MLEELLGKDIALGIYKKGYDSAFMEKGAQLGWLSSIGRGFKNILGSAVNVPEKGVNLTKDMVDALLKIGLLGTVAGALSGTGYNIVKQRLSESSPEEDKDMKLKELYVGKNQELKDSQWLAKAREKRDNLMRNKNKMSTEDYTKEYIDLVNILRERSDV